MGSYGRKWGITTWAAMTGLRKYCMGAYGLIGEILHGKLWPDLGNTAWEVMVKLARFGTAWAAMATLGKYRMGRYGDIGEIPYWQDWGL